MGVPHIVDVGEKRVEVGFIAGIVFRLVLVFALAKEKDENALLMNDDDDVEWGLRFKGGGILSRLIFSRGGDTNDDDDEEGLGFTVATSVATVAGSRSNKSGNLNLNSGEILSGKKSKSCSSSNMLQE